MTLSPDRKAKIHWNCRRGMLELDLVFKKFLSNLDDLSEPQLMAFEQLLTCSDPDLYAWFMGESQPENKELFDIVTYIRLHNCT